MHILWLKIITIYLILSYLIYLFCTDVIPLKGDILGQEKDYSTDVYQWLISGSKVGSNLEKMEFCYLTNWIGMFY